MFDALTLHQPAFGLDLSDRSFKIVYLKKHKKEWSLAFAKEFFLPEGIMEQGEIKQPDALVQEIQKAWGSHHNLVPTPHVIASLPEEQAFLQVIQLPAMQKEELEHAVRFEAENYIPHALEKVYLDFQVVQPLSNHLDHQDVLLAALPKSIVQAYQQVFLRVGLKPKAFEIESLALARALVAHELSLAPLLLIDFGATRTSFIIFSGHSVRFTTSIPISSTQLTLAVAQRLGIPEKEAETLKIHYGLERQNEKQGKEVYDTLLPILSDLIGQMKKHLAYYESHDSHQHLGGNFPQIRKVVVSGGGADLKGFVQFLEQSLDLQAVLGNPWINIVGAGLNEFPSLPFEESLRYATALGLALRGVTKND